MAGAAGVSLFKAIIQPENRTADLWHKDVKLLEKDSKNTCIMCF